MQHTYPVPELYSSGFLMVFCNVIALIFVLVRWPTNALAPLDVSLTGAACT